MNSICLKTCPVDVLQVLETQMDVSNIKASQTLLAALEILHYTSENIRVAQELAVDRFWILHITNVCEYDIYLALKPYALLTVWTSISMNCMYAGWLLLIFRKISLCHFGIL